MDDKVELANDLSIVIQAIRNLDLEDACSMLNEIIKEIG